MPTTRRQAALQEELDSKSTEKNGDDKTELGDKRHAQNKESPDPNSEPPTKRAKAEPQAESKEQIKHVPQTGMYKSMAPVLD